MELATNTLAKYIQQNLATPPNLMNESKAKRNADIDIVISALLSKMTGIYKNAPLSDYIEYTVCLVCKGLGGKMKNDEAVLLPTLHKEFVMSFCPA